MLKKDFIRTLSDWVGEHVAQNQNALHKAMADFELEKYAIKSNADPSLSGLFSEWLVYDYKQELFEGGTGIEYFVKHNPVNLSSEELDEYKDAQNYEAGLFEVASVTPGLGLELVSFISNKRYVVNDVTASLSVKKDQDIWARIAPVRGSYHMLCCVFVPFPIKIGLSLRENIAKEKSPFTAKEIVPFLFDNSGKIGSRKLFWDSSPNISIIKAKKDFEDALRGCGMNNLFSVDTYIGWIINEKKFGSAYYIKSLLFLIPEETNDGDVRKLINSAMILANNTPRKILKGKTPAEASATVEDKDRDVKMDVHTKEKYIDMLKEASASMGKEDFKRAFKQFENTLKELHKSKFPFFSSFRIYANAALCCFRQNKYDLGEEILNAALRINPSYDFAKRVMTEYIDPINDFSDVKKEFMKYAKDLRKSERSDGVRKYKRTIFSKYEAMLHDLHITLDYATKTVPTVYKGNKQLKIGRNDPCFCGSGKKFKKCCML